ncbi:MAG TPA: GntR family transcriptional regulator [Planctomycetota bacterium]|nr:GntR family transcriptional regulator [Planctomycetota bacterium]
MERDSKRIRILEKLRDEIVAGRFLPGSRLPTRDELSRNFRASRVTIQRALDRLNAEGFIESRRRGGTSVTAHPPHLFRYGLVIPREPGSADWVRFWTALCNEANALDPARGRSISIYYGIDSRAPTREYLRLQDDVQNSRLAGVIFAAQPRFLEGTPLLEERLVPMVSVTGTTGYQRMPGIGLNSHAFFDRSLDFLLARKRKRIAVLTVPGLSEGFDDFVTAGIAARGLISHPWWTQQATQSYPRAAFQIVRLLMQARDSAERPDGLIITDDNLVEQATAGLVAAGVRVPEELDVVAHCNFPWPTPNVVPVTRVGYDSRKILQAGMNAIDQERSGKSAQHLTLIDAELESTLARI